MAKECDSTLVHGVLRAATQVHRTLGPGLLESIYERALSLELSGNGIGVKSQVPVSVLYRGTDLGLGFRLDLLVADCLIVEVKCVTRLDHSHVKQLLTYLRLTDIETGFLSTSITRRSRPGLNAFLCFRKLSDLRVLRGDLHLEINQEAKDGDGNGIESCAARHGCTAGAG